MADAPDAAAVVAAGFVVFWEDKENYFYTGARITKEANIVQL